MYLPKRGRKHDCLLISLACELCLEIVLPERGRKRRSNIVDTKHIV